MNLSRKGRKVMQQEEYQVVERIPTVEDYLVLREAVGWGRLDEQMTARGLANALFTVCLLHNGKVIGCGRVIGDGGLYFYLQDIIVLPAFQGKGLGRRLMRAILAYLEEHALPGAFVGLMAAKDVSSFYTQFGFALRPPERPGMFRLQEGPHPPTTSQQDACMDTNA
jgi:GNAT superfamily N-acetyltransferase